MTSPVPSADRPIERDAAFGIVPIFIPEDATLEDVDYFEYLVIQHHAGHWGFPKGHAEGNETPQESACREFVEETGIATKDFTLLPGADLQETYRIDKTKRAIDKTVTYFPARIWTREVNVQPEEIQAFAWGNYQQTLERLTYDANKKVLREVHATAIERLDKSLWT
ncbi:MAG: bis(5'-nucleosyl)-tetraphosphatase [Geitlerinemataceae cyanobacterium]